MIDNVSGLYPKLKTFGYPKVGQRNAICRIGVKRLDANKTVWVKTSDDLRNHYIAKMQWSEGSGGLIIQQLNRSQDTNTLFKVNPDNGSVNVILNEHDEAWVYANSELYWKENNTIFTWMSDRNGWRHAYLCSSDGKKIKPITHTMPWV